MPKGRLVSRRWLQTKEKPTILTTEQAGQLLHPVYSTGRPVPTSCLLDRKASFTLSWNRKVSSHILTTEQEGSSAF